MKIPKNLRELPIDDMLVGESGYAFPWAMFADEHEEVYINGNYGYSETPTKKHMLYIKRKKNGFVVDISKCKNKRWTVRYKVYINEKDKLPIIKIKE